MISVLGPRWRTRSARPCGMHTPSAQRGTSCAQACNACVLRPRPARQSWPRGACAVVSIATSGWPAAAYGARRRVSRSHGVSRSGEGPPARSVAILRHRRACASLQGRLPSAHTGVPRLVMVADHRAGDRAVHTMGPSSGSPAVRVSSTDCRGCARGAWGRTFVVDRPQGDAPGRQRGHGATPRVRQARAPSFAARTPRPRPYPSRSQSLTAALAPPHSAGSLLRRGGDKKPGRAFRPTHPMASYMPPPSLVSRNMISSSNRSTPCLSNKKHERIRH